MTFDKEAQTIYDALGRGSDSDVRRIAAALRRSREEAIEDCAKVAKMAACGNSDCTDEHCPGNYTRDAILALKDTPHG